jgi:glycosyltransferase involved in cell wall biosynthesis
MVIKNRIPLFSVLLPTHNREDVIGYAIESVLAQSTDDFELLVVGDGCTHSTESIVKGFVRQDQRVKWFPFPKGAGFGYGHRNTVLAKAHGKYIAFAAHDDLWFPDHLELFAALFESRPKLIFAYSRPLWIHVDGTLIPSCFNLNNDRSRTIFESRNEIPAQCVVHTRSSGERVGYYDTEVKQAGDWDLWRRILQTAPFHEIGFIGSPSSIHFTASWRPEDYIFQWAALRATYGMINSSTEFSKKLRVQPEKHRPLQDIIWENTVQDASWVRDLRQNIEAFLDLQVQNVAETAANGEAREKIRELEVKISGLEANLAQAYTEVDQLATHTRVMEATRGYRALQFIRRLARPFRNIK